MTGSPATAPASRRTLSRALVISAIVTFIVAVLLGLIVAPFMFAIALIGVVDLVLAWLFATGRIGAGAAERRAAERGEPGIGADAAAGDPSYNRYARED